MLKILQALIGALISLFLGSSIFSLFTLKQREKEERKEKQNQKRSFCHL